MPFNFKNLTNELPNYQEAMQKFTAAVQEGQDKEITDGLYAEAMNTLGTDLTERISVENKKELESMFDSRLENKGLTAKEIKFFNSIKGDVGTKNEILLPEETINQVFDDLKSEHPLLSIINFKNAGLRLKALIAETEGTAVWGKSTAKSKGNWMLHSRKKISNKTN
ncbi:hypothetical protein AAFF39_03730 [Lactococcus garvieae]